MAQEHTATSSTGFLAEDLERDQAAVGIEVPSTVEEYFSTATPENIRNFGRSYGDDNPLYTDAAYGQGTRWNGQIAPPIMAAILNAPLKMTGTPPRLGSLRGVHAFVSGGTWEWFRPVYPGDRLFSFSCLLTSELKPSRSAGNLLIRTRRTVKLNERADVVGTYRSVMIYTPGGEHEPSEPRSVERAEPAVPAYSDADLSEIDRLYEQESVRGAEPRWAEELAVGQALPPMVKGPLTVTDIIIFHAGGYGFAPYGLKTGKPGYLNRQRIPGFYSKNEYGVPDVAQRMHWDAQRAQATGSPRPYDFGILRECWFHQYLTSWIGDEGWLLSQGTRVRKFNRIGDTQTLSGVISSIRMEDDCAVVELSGTASNQWGEETTTMEATVLLPRKGRGSVVLPQPPDDLRRTAYSVMTQGSAE